MSQYREVINLKLVLDGVSKFFGEIAVLVNLRAHFNSPQAVVVTGRNGSGKSTLIRLLAGLSYPSQGRIYYYYQKKPYSPQGLQKRMGIVSPDLELYQQLTVEETIKLFAGLHGAPLTKQRITDYLIKHQLSEYKTKPVAACSWGIRQRLKLAVALVHHPWLLLLDEPTTNLDEQGKSLVYELVAEHKQTALVVFATNDPKEVNCVGDQVISLDQQPAVAGKKRVNL